MAKQALSPTWLEQYSCPEDFVNQEDLDACYEKVDTYCKVMGICRWISSFTLGYIGAFGIFLVIFLTCNIPFAYLVSVSLVLWAVLSLVVVFIWKTPKIQQFTAGTIDSFQKDGNSYIVWIRTYKVKLPFTVSKGFTLHNKPGVRVVLYEFKDGNTDFLCMPDWLYAGCARDFFMTC